MLSKILLPTDFSDHSIKCLNYVKKMADCGIEEVVVMHVVDYKIIKEADIVFDGTVDEEEVTAKSIAKAEQEIRKFAEPLKGLDFKISYLVKAGNPCSEIVKTAEELNVSMIIMGHRGHNLAEELLLGSTAEKVSRKSSKAVLLIK